MAKITVDQAIFASADNSRVQGYQLVARSEGIDDEIAHALRTWSPTHGGLFSDDPNTEGHSYFPINDKLVAVGRSVYGSPEYSGRGGLQTVTLFIVTGSDHMGEFDYDPWSLSLVARSQGLLRFNPPFPQQLPKVLFPSKCSLPTAIIPPDANLEIADAAIELVAQERDVAVVGLIDPIPTLQAVIALLSPDQRRLTSFATGLQPSAQRPFRVQFVVSADVRLRAELSNNRVAIVKYSDEQVTV